MRDVAVTRLVGSQADARAPHVAAEGHGRGSMFSEEVEDLGVGSFCLLSVKISYATVGGT